MRQVNAAVVQHLRRRREIDAKKAKASKLLGNRSIDMKGAYAQFCSYVPNPTASRGTVMLAKKGGGSPAVEQWLKEKHSHTLQFWDWVIHSLKTDTYSSAKSENENELGTADSTDADDDASASSEVGTDGGSVEEGLV